MYKRQNRETSNEDSMFLMFDDESDGSSDSEDEIYDESSNNNLNASSNDECDTQHASEINHLETKGTQLVH